MRLKATFVIELEAADFVAAAELQKTLEQTLVVLQEQFPQAELKITERRQRAGGVPRNARGAGLSGRLQGLTGHLNVYRND